MFEHLSARAEATRVDVRQMEKQAIEIEEALAKVHKVKINF